MRSVTRYSSVVAAIMFRYKSKVPSECSPGDGTPLIVYKDLVSDIEAVFTVEELEKKSATTNVEQVTFYWRLLRILPCISQATAEVHWHLLRILSCVSYATSYRSSPNISYRVRAQRERPKANATISEIVFRPREPETNSRLHESFRSAG